MNTDGLQAVRDEDELEAALAHPLVVLYKHSPLCGMSVIAAVEVRKFAEEDAAAPVYVLDVLRQRALARSVERRFGIRHESPQVIVLRDGVPVWNASLRGVTAAGIRAAVG